MTGTFVVVYREDMTYRMSRTLGKWVFTEENNDELIIADFVHIFLHKHKILQTIYMQAHFSK